MYGVFLDLVRYLAVSLPHLAEHTRILTLLTMKEAHKCFLKWETSHNFAFESIKALVCSPQCLTVINHVAPGENKIFLTCDASDWQTGATLSFGHTWETVYPVAYESAQLSGAEKNYPIHKKELLVIIWALKKWRSNLLGSTIYFYTDHKTLLNFNGQKDLSQRQLWWQEYMSQYELCMHYIQGEDNTVADALSQLPPESIGAVCALAPHVVWASGVKVTMSLSTDGSVLQAIKDGYKSDPFCDQLSKTSTPGTTFINNLWYIGNRLLIPRVGVVAHKPPNACFWV